MLRIWLIIPLAVSGFFLLGGLNAGLREKVGQTTGESQIAELMRFWIRERGDRTGLSEALDVLRKEAGFSAVELCYRGNSILLVGVGHDSCEASSSLYNRVSKHSIAGLKGYALVSHSHLLSSKAALLYFFSLLSFVAFLVSGVLVSRFPKSRDRELPLRRTH